MGINLFRILLRIAIADEDYPQELGVIKCAGYPRPNSNYCINFITGGPLGDRSLPPNSQFEVGRFCQNRRECSPPLK